MTVFNSNLLQKFMQACHTLVERLNKLQTWQRLIALFFVSTILASIIIVALPPRPTFAAPLSSLRPVSPDSTANTITYSTGTTAWNLIDDDPDSPDTADYVQATTRNSGSIFLNLTNMDTTFVSMDTLQVDAHVTNFSGGNDTVVLSAQVFQSDGATSLTNSMQVSTDTDASGLKSITFTGLNTTANKTTWDGALLRLGWVNNQNQGPDDNYIRVNAVELDGSYTQSISYTQTSYRFFNNTDSTDVGTALANQNTALGNTVTPAQGTPFRLRMLIQVGSATLGLSGQQFKLQYAQAATCSSGTYADVTTSTPIAYHDNTTPADGSALTANANDPTATTVRNQTYEEANNFTNSQNSIGAGEDGKWDFSLVVTTNANPNTSYCLRAVTSTGTALTSYTNYPQLTTQQRTLSQGNYRWFENDDSISERFANITRPDLPTNTAYGTAFSPDGTYKSVAHATSPFITIYKRSGDTMMKLADPTGGLPPGTGNGIAWSADGTYMSVAHTASPFITIYKRSGDTFTKLADPATLPTNTAYGTAFSPDGTYMSVAHAGSPFITIYKRSGDTFTKLADPATLPNALNATNTAWSSDSVYMVVTYGFVDNLTIYKRSGDTFTKLADPATLPPATSTSAAFSPDGTYLSVAHNTSPFITIYKRSGDTFTKLADPATLPTNTAYGTAFSPDGTYMSVAHATSPFVTIYKRSGDTFTKLADPTGGLPTGNGRGTAFSPDGTYMSVAHETSPFITIYKRTGDTFAKPTNPDTLPASTGYGTAFSPDGTYKSVAHSASPYITIYKRSGDSFAKLADPTGGLPTGTGGGTAFSPDGTYMSVAHATSPYITIYKRSGDTFTKLADPTGGLPPSTGNGTAFSPDGTYMSVAHGTSPFITIYKRSGDTFTKLADPTGGLPPSTGNGTAFSPDGTYMSVAHGTSPFITIYKRSGDSFAKLADPTGGLPTGTGRGTAFSPDGTYMSVAYATSPYITIYKRSGDSFAKLADPTGGLPPNNGNGTAFSPDGTYMSVAHGTSPFVTIYKRSGDTFTKLADPATLPTGSGIGTAFSPDGTYMSVAHSASPYITIYKTNRNVDYGPVLASQDTNVDTTSATSQQVRLRAGVNTSGHGMNPGDETFKLQYAARGTDLVCDASATGESYSDVSAEQLSSTSFQDASTFVNDQSAGTESWITPGNAASSDDSRTTVTMFSTNSYYLKATNFGFSIPANSRITGISAAVEGLSSTGDLLIYSHIVKNNVTHSSEVGSFTLANPETIYEFGGDNNLWGVQLTPADVNSSNFGASFRIIKELPGTPTASIDHIQLKVHYELLPEQGPNSASSYRNDFENGNGWTNMSNASSSDNAYASATIPSATFTDSLVATNFGFNIPINATITGIVAEVERYGVTNTGDYLDSGVFLVKGGVAQSGDDKSSLVAWSETDTNQYIAYGSSTDLWLNSFTPSDVNDSGFGISISASIDNPLGGTVNVDHIRLTVYYDDNPPIEFFDNPTPVDGAAISSSESDPTPVGSANVHQSYEEQNNVSLVNSVTAGQDALWDFSLQVNAIDIRKTYCLRLVKADNTPLDSYSNFPHFTTAPAPQQIMPGGSWWADGAEQTLRL